MPRGVLMPGGVLRRIDASMRIELVPGGVPESPLKFGHGGV